MRARSVAAALGASLAGCAVLTESQVAAVHEFAERSRPYAELPPRVLEAYGELRARRAVLEAAARPYGNSDAGGRAVTKLRQTVELRRQLDPVLEDLRLALAVLETYSQLLETLSTADEGSPIDKPALEMGEALDDAAHAYGEREGKTFPQVGPAAAAAVRGAAGVYFKVRQASYVKAFVEQADPIVQDVTAHVASLLARYGSDAGAGRASTLDVERSELEAGLVEAATNEPALGYDALNAYYRNLAGTAATQALADRLVEASRAYGLAHARLRERLHEPVDLPHGVEEVKALGAAISKASELKDKVEEAEALKAR